MTSEDSRIINQMRSPVCVYLPLLQLQGVFVALADLSPGCTALVDFGLFYLYITVCKYISPLTIPKQSVN